MTSKQEVKRPSVVTHRQKPPHTPRPPLERHDDASNIYELFDEWGVHEVGDLVWKEGIWFVCLRAQDGTRPNGNVGFEEGEGRYWAALDHEKYTDAALVWCHNYTYDKGWKVMCKGQWYQAKRETDECPLLSKNCWRRLPLHSEAPSVPPAVTLIPDIKSEEKSSHGQDPSNKSKEISGVKCVQHIQTRVMVYTGTLYTPWQELILEQAFTTFIGFHLPDLMQHVFASFFPHPLLEMIMEFAASSEWKSRIWKWPNGAWVSGRGTNPYPCDPFGGRWYDQASRAVDIVPDIRFIGSIWWQPAVLSELERELIAQTEILPTWVGDTKCTTLGTLLPAIEQQNPQVLFSAHFHLHVGKKDRLCADLVVKVIWHPR